MSSNEFVKSTAILTEHLGYAPIALIDDVINAVNEILYKCTNAMEAFLSQRYPPRAQGGGDATEGGEGQSTESEEIELGTAKLETFLESLVDRSFDKYELYVLRNIFVIPFDLIAEGWIRLGHHRNVDFKTATITIPTRPGASSPPSDKLLSLYDQISLQKRANSLLKAHTRRVDKLLTNLEQYSTSFVIPPSGLENSSTVVPDEIKSTYKDIAPISETIVFLVAQIQAITDKAAQIQQVMAENANVVSQHASTLERDLFVDTLSKRAVDIAGLNSTSNFVKVISKSSQQDAENLIQLLQNKQEGEEVDGNFDNENSQ